MSGHWILDAAPTRVVIASDAACEADDQFAIAQALLTPTFDLRGIIPDHFREPGSQERSRAEVNRLLALTNLSEQVVVADGAPAPLQAEHEIVDSPGARLIVEESHGEGRLFIAVLGPLTTVASAILLDPSIAKRDVVVVWIGGMPYDGVYAPWESCYNLANDHLAANVVFSSGVTVWQIPMDVYSSVSVGYAELESRVRPYGELGEYLVDQLIAFNRERHRLPIDGRILGDSPAIGVILNAECARWKIRPPVRFLNGSRFEPSPSGAPVRAAVAIDQRYVLEDFFAKLRLHAAGAWPSARTR